jgi:hypothetical protein
MPAGNTNPTFGRSLEDDRNASQEGGMGKLSAVTCAEKMKLLSLWSQSVTALSKATADVHNAMDKGDLSTHTSQLARASELHIEVRNAHAAFEEHVRMHGCNPSMPSLAGER